MPTSFKTPVSAWVGRRSVKLSHDSAAPTHNKPSATDARPKAWMVGFTPGGKPPRAATVKPRMQAMISGFRISCRRMTNGFGRPRLPSMAKARVVTLCTKGTMMPVATAPKLMPSAPKIAPTMAKPIRLLKRIPPCRIEVMAACPCPIKRASSTEISVPVASAPQMVKAMAPSGRLAGSSAASAERIRLGSSTQ